MRDLVKELLLVFNTGIIAVTIWYYIGIFIFPDLYTIDLQLLDLLTHFAVPIQIIAVMLGYIEIFLLKKVNVY